MSLLKNQNNKSHHQNQKKKRKKTKNKNKRPNRSMNKINKKSNDLWFKNIL